MSFPSRPANDRSTPFLTSLRSTAGWDPTRLSRACCRFSQPTTVADGLDLHALTSSRHNLNTHRHAHLLPEFSPIRLIVAHMFQEQERSHWSPPVSGHVSLPVDSQ